MGLDFAFLSDSVMSDWVRVAVIDIPIVGVTAIGGLGTPNLSVEYFAAVPFEKVLVR